MSVQLVRALEEPSYHGAISLMDVIRPRTMPFKNPEIKSVIFNNPATIILWKDGTKTVVKRQPGDHYNEKIGFLLCVAKKYFGNTGKYNNIIREYAPYDFPDEKNPVNVISCNYCNKHYDASDCQMKVETR